ncbi:O-antigen ligase family protein [Clostridium perfringens]
MTKISVEKIVNSFVYSSLLVGIYIYIDTFRGQDWSDSMGYLYASKNSISTIFVIAVICILLYWKNKSMSVKYSVLIFFIVLIFMMKSRTSILGLLFSYIYFLTFVIENKKKKLIYLSIFISIILFILCNENLNNLIINKIIFNNRIGSDLNSLSSGRVDHFNIFFENFKFNPLVGNGGMYLESFPLAILISYGIIGSIFIFILSISPIIIGFIDRNSYKYIKVRRLMILLNIVLIVNGLFEELSPFGPGVKCYLLWVITGIYLGLIVKEERRNNNV